MTAPGLGERLRTRAFTVTTELVPPRGASAVAVADTVSELAFADGINVTDLPGARTRMSALAAAALVRAAGRDPILQMTCRDRNRLALAADAIGAAALGVEAILPLFGDPVPDDVEAAEIRDVDSAGLVALLRDLAAGRTPDGLDLDPPAQLAVGAAAAPGRNTVASIAAKLDAGATFVQTQIVLDIDGFEEWFAGVREAGLTARAAFLPGVAVPASARMCERLAGYGAMVSPDVVERAERGEGETVASEIVERLVSIDGVAGVHLMPLQTAPATIAGLAATARRAAGIETTTE